MLLETQLNISKHYKRIVFGVYIILFSSISFSQQNVTIGDNFKEIKLEKILWYSPVLNASESSIEKQTSGIEDSINFLTEESIITGKIIGLFVDPETQYALYLSNDNGKNLVKNFPNKGWDQNNSLKKTFQFLDGSIIEIGEKKYEIPLIIFYPSGENSGGVLNIYHEDYIQRVSIKNNGKILNEPISY